MTGSGLSSRGTTDKADMGTDVYFDDGHECRGCWPLQEPTLENALEEIVAHEDPRGRFVTIADAHESVERYSLDARMTKVYLEARNLDWR